MPKAFYIVPYKLVPYKNPDKWPDKYCAIDDYVDLRGFWAESQVLDPDDGLGRAIVVINAPSEDLVDLDLEYTRLPDGYMEDGLLRAQLEQPRKKHEYNEQTKELKCIGETVPIKPIEDCEAYVDGLF